MPRCRSAASICGPRTSCPGSTPRQARRSRSRRSRCPPNLPGIVESKSVKLYLTAINQTRFASESDVGATIGRDLSSATGATVGVALTLPRDFADAAACGACGRLPRCTCRSRSTDSALVPEALVAEGPTVDESLCTRLFRSVCPVTGQPDYASVQLRYRGARIDPAGLLALPRVLPPASGLPRALRRADLRRRLAALPARTRCPSTRGSRGAAASTSIRSARAATSRLLRTRGRRGSEVVEWGGRRMSR